MPLQPAETLELLTAGGTLTDAHATDAFESILSGAFDEPQLRTFLTLIAQRGPTIDELVAGARVMRRHAVPVPLGALQAAGGDGPIVLDTCGTGGAPKTFNVSTAAAFVVAAAAKGRVVVAKHGGRSRTGRGSAEVLQRLGVNIDAPPDVQARCLAEAGVCFSFAVNHHPAMKHAAAVRRSLGFPTIFNLIGPLANPAGATRQLIGTYSPDLALKLAHALVRLGTERAIVVTSRDGMDELTTTGENILHEVRGGRVLSQLLDAASLGLDRAARTELEIGTLDAAAEVIRRVLQGEHGPCRDIVVLNAAAALHVCDVVPSVVVGIVSAARAIDDGEAMRMMTALVRLSNT